MNANVEEKSPDLNTFVRGVNENAAYRNWAVYCYHTRDRGVIQETSNLKQGLERH